MKVNTVALVFFTLISSACQSSKIQNQTYVDKNYDVSTFERFTWAGDRVLTVMGPLHGGDSSELEKRLKTSTQLILAEKGYIYVAIADDPELIVSFVAGTDDKTTTSQNADGFGTQTNEYLQGDISVVFKSVIDLNTIWQGTATGRIDHLKLGGEEGEALGVLLEKALESLPPSQASRTIK